MKKFYILLLLTVIAFLVWLGLKNQEEIKVITSDLVPQDLNYVFARDFTNAGKIRKIHSGLGPITRLRVSEDGTLLLAPLLTGEVLAFNRSATSWRKQKDPLVKIDTKFNGLPTENGLLDVVFSADFDETGEIFLLYASLEKADDPNTPTSEQIIKNFIARSKITLAEGTWQAEEPVVIFEANTQAGSAHQIQSGLGVMIEDESHLLFTVGDGFKAENAQDLRAEAGKMLLITREGLNPKGPRPYPNFPKIQAIGFRNPPDFAFNPKDSDGRIALVDTGPDENDKIVYAKLIDLNSKPVSRVNLLWSGTAKSAGLAIPDRNSKVKNSAVYHWVPTYTPTNIVFHPGKGKLPVSEDEKSTILVSLFGTTGQTGKDARAREIWLGVLDYAGEPSVSWRPFIIRSGRGFSEKGHPIGLVLDPLTNDLLFADIIEGSIYSVEIDDALNSQSNLDGDPNN